MPACLDVVFESVPRAYDVQVRFVEGESMAFAAFVDHFVHARDDFPLADRPALVSAFVQIGVEFSARAKNADRGLADINDQPPPTSATNTPRT